MRTIVASKQKLEGVILNRERVCEYLKIGFMEKEKRGWYGFLMELDDILKMRLILMYFKLYVSEFLLTVRYVCRVIILEL